LLKSNAVLAAGLSSKDLGDKEEGELSSDQEKGNPIPTTNLEKPVRNGDHYII
jgi:hypothetical protein